MGFVILVKKKFMARLTIAWNCSPVVLIEPQPKLDDTIRIQQQAGPYEQSMWHQRGAKKDSQEIWRAHEGQIVAPTSLLNILICRCAWF